MQRTRLAANADTRPIPFADYDLDPHQPNG
ncbi:hypothetical protein THIOKS110010 [Thiocapsa sp. KS1]|nr:hypothetical protein THIOKS110010 [Thiocapsa sp. KS1]